MPEAAAALVRVLLAALLLVGLAVTFLPPRRTAAGTVFFCLLIAVSPSGLLLLGSRSAASALGLGLALPLAALAPSWRVAVAGAAAAALALSGLDAGGWILLLALPGAVLAARSASPGAARAGLFLSAAGAVALLALSGNGSLEVPRMRSPATAFLFPLPAIPAGGSFSEAVRSGWARTLRLARGEDLLGAFVPPASGGQFRFARLWETLAPFLSTLALGGALSLSAMTFLRPRGRRAPAPALFAAALLCLVYVLDVLVGGFLSGPSAPHAGRVFALPLIAFALAVFGSTRRLSSRTRNG
jgi:hypothetical protein